ASLPTRGRRTPSPSTRTPGSWPATSHSFDALSSPAETSLRAGVLDQVKRSEADRLSAGLHLEEVRPCRRKDHLPHRQDEARLRRRLTRCPSAHVRVAADRQGRTSVRIEQIDPEFPAPFALPIPFHRQRQHHVVLFGGKSGGVQLMK